MPEIRETKDPQALFRIGPTVTVSVGINNELSRFYLAGGISQPTPIHLTALIDTGSGLTVIQAGKIDGLGLNPIGHQGVIGVNDKKEVMQPLFRVGIAIYGQDYFDVSAVVQPLNFRGIDCLICRDMLAHCKLEYDGITGKYSIFY